MGGGEDLHDILRKQNQFIPFKVHDVVANHGVQSQYKIASTYLEL